MQILHFRSRSLPILIFLLMSACILIPELTAGPIKYPKKKEITKRVNYLERIIREPWSVDSEVFKIGEHNHEWMLFSYSFSSFALTNIALRDSCMKGKASSLIKTAITRSMHPWITSNYDVDSSLLQYNYFPDYSVLYLGHLNLMLGCYRMLSEDSSFNGLNDRISASLAERYKQCPYHNLDSYPGGVWIPDNAVAITSLKMHAHNTGSSHDSVSDMWIHYVKENYIDAETGLLYSTVNSANGKPQEEPRGSMLGWSLMFIQQLDSAFAHQQYVKYKKQFSKNCLIFRLYRERKDDKSTDMGDIDSGPLFYGFSIPANQFVLSTALFIEDYPTARKIRRLINFGTKTKRKNNQLHYEIRFVDYQISPMAEALVLFSLTTTSWF